MKKTTVYLLRSLVSFLTLTALYFIISWLRTSITYAYENHEHTTSIQQTTLSIQSNSDQRNQIDQQIKLLHEQISNLRQQQKELQDTNVSLRQQLSTQKDLYQDFLGFNSGKKE